MLTQWTVRTMLYESGVSILIWLACAAVVFGGLYACSLILEKPLLPPGWRCDHPLVPWDTPQCRPAEGYHFEEHGGARVAVHDIGAPALRQRDLDTADGWHLLNDKQRRQILDGKATIYDFAGHAH